MQRRRHAGVTRREFLRRSAALAVGVPLSGVVLAACEAGARHSASRGARSAALSPLPIHADNPPIDGGQPIEQGGTLRIFQWHEYLSADVLDSFAHRHREHDVGYEVTSFETMAEAIETLRRPGSRFDVFYPTIDVLDALVDARVLRPLNHDYLPNLANLWPQFLGDADPFYDPGQRYTVPYTVYSTGIGWRTDLVRPADAPDVLPDPYDVYWNPRYRGMVGIYDDYREAIAMALLHRGVLDVNTARTSDLRAAADDLIAMAEAVDVEVSTEGAYEELPSGEYAVNQAWSGDMLSAKRFGTVDSEARRLIDYWWPRDGAGVVGVVGADLTAIPAQGENPVLAHAFVNHLLAFDVAMDNFSWNGYQPPVEGATPEAFADPSFPWHSVVPDHLRSAILTPEDLDRGRFLLGLEASVDASWLAEWRRFLASRS